MNISVADAPESVKVRHVTVTEVDENGDVLSTRVETPVAEYWWKVDDQHVSGDLFLPCMVSEDEDQGEVVATLTKVRPDGEVAYGPADVRQKQYDVWKKAGAVK